MSKSPKFLVAHHLAARMLLYKADIVLDADGAHLRRTPLKQKTVRKLIVLAKLILDHQKVRLPDSEEHMFREWMADKRYGRVVSEMELKLGLLNQLIHWEWDSLCERYEADAPLQSTADTHA